MKYDLTTPCAHCPFRSDIQPFISMERARSIITGNAEFACHKTVDYSDDDEGKTRPNSQHCAGLLILLEKMGQPHQMMRIAERLGMYDASKLKMDAPVYDTGHQAITAHRKVRA